MKKYILLAVLLVCGVAFTYWAQDKVAWGTWNYRITVEIETPEGIKSGSAVRQVTAFSRPPLLGENNGNTIDVKGEAVVIDLGERGVVFGLIGWGSYNDVFNAFPAGRSSDFKEKIRYFDSLKAGTKAELEKDAFPMFVTFMDINDPKSVRLVKGGRFNVKRQKFDPIDDFEEIFGEGAALRKVIIEIIDDPVMEQIEDWLPWSDKVKGGYLDGQFSGGGPELSNILHGGNFKTEGLR